ncbi:MAG: type II toxin-antitoxin system VapC family toxin [Chloroflexi bacterium]|nr:type II toxin-antitoxin system VapC family toxin [Chloroflexota bacterium]
MIFLDTSAIYAMADRADPHHHRAVELFRHALEAGEDVLVHSYILIEAAALLQSRLSLASALRFLREASAFHLHWIGPHEHQQAVTLLEQRRRRDLSLVDCASFGVMQEYKVEKAIAFDPDFEREGFTLYGTPSPSAG